MRRLAPLLILAFVLAGCSGSSGDGGDGGDGQDPTTSPRPDVDIAAELPTWQAGQGWRYVVDVPGERTQTFTMMVVEQRGELWVVGANDRDQALHHAVYSTNPVLGRIGVETLSPFQDGEPVAMYRFPLTDGKEWSARFFGETMQFDASFVGDILLQPSLGLGGFAEGFRVRATGPSGVTVAYDYVEAAQWFTSFEVLNANGSRQIRLDLVERVDDYSGPYHFFRGDDLLVETHTSQATEPVVETLTVPSAERFTDGMAIGVSYLGRQSEVPPVANMTVTGSDGEIYYQREFTGLGQVFDVQDLHADVEADYTVDLRVTGNVELEVRVISYQAFAEGTL